jgi:hypothetical protein
MSKIGRIYTGFVVSLFWAFAGIGVTAALAAIFQKPFSLSRSDAIVHPLIIAVVGALIFYFAYDQLGSLKIEAEVSLISYCLAPAGWQFDAYLTMSQCH